MWFIIRSFERVVGMASNTSPRHGRGVLTVAVTALLVASAAAAGVSLTAVGTASAAPTQITDCTVIDESGTYELANDITIDGDERSSPCIDIRANDVTFDGNGYAIRNVEELGDTPAFIAANTSDTLVNVTVRDVRLENTPTSYRNTVDFDGVSNSTIANVDVTPWERTSGSTFVGVVGDDNTVTGLTGANLSVIGDDNRVADSSFQGIDFQIGVAVYGDDNVVENVSSNGLTGLVVAGADNRVANGSFNGVLQTPDVRIENATGTEFVNNTDLASNSRNAFVVLANSTESTIEGNALGVEFRNSDDNTIRTNTVGTIRIDNESTSNLIYDNRITGSPQFADAPGSNTWNVSPRPGENVVGGDTVAGNYYSDYSETCEDTDSDGLCDSPNELAENNTDYHPLALGENASPSFPYFQITSLDVPSQFEEGEAAPVTVTVTNIGSEADTQRIRLVGDFVAGGAVDLLDQTVTLDGGETATLTFNVTYDSAENYDGLYAQSDDTTLSKSVTLVDTEATNYQVDFVAGDPIDELGEDGLYAEQNRLMRFAFGNSEDGITERDTAWPNESIRSAVDYGHIGENENGTASVTFTVADGENVTLSLVTYSLPGETFSMETADQQELLNATTETYGPGEHTITVDLPGENENADGGSDE